MHMAYITDSKRRSKDLAYNCIHPQSPISNSAMSNPKNEDPNITSKWYTKAFI